jgi:hypothetical protein
VDTCLLQCGLPDHLTAKRGDERIQGGMFSYVSLGQHAPLDHSLRAARKLTDAVLQTLSPEFDALYADSGRSSIATEYILRAPLFQVFYSVRSDRLLVEQIGYNLLFRWYVGLGMDDGDGTAFHGHNRSNKTPESTTDAAARLYKKSYGKELKLSYLGNALVKNSNGLIAAAMATHAGGYADRDSALLMLAEKQKGRSRRITVEADKA